MLSLTMLIVLGCAVAGGACFLLAWALCEASARSEREYEAQLMRQFHAARVRREQGHDDAA